MRLKPGHPVSDGREDDGGDESERDDVEETPRKKPGRGAAGFRKRIKRG